MDLRLSKLLHSFLDRVRFRCSVRKIQSNAVFRARDAAVAALQGVYSGNVELARRKYGNKRRWQLEFFDSDGYPWFVFVPSSPPESKLDFEDDEGEFYPGGYHLNREAWKQVDDPEIQTWMDRGVEPVFEQMVPRFDGRNYKSVELEYPVESKREFMRLSGEGPESIEKYEKVFYVPHIVNSFGMVVKEDFSEPGKIKFRLCWDCTKSGVNEASARYAMYFDHLKDALPEMEQDVYMYIVDGKDAYLTFPFTLAFSRPRLDGTGEDHC